MIFTEVHSVRRILIVIKYLIELGYYSHISEELKLIIRGAYLI